MPRSKVQRILITRAQELGLLTIVTAVDWPNGMNDMSRRQISASSDHRLAGGQPLRILCSSDFATGCENCRPAGAVNRAIDAATTQQSRVGCVYDCINFQVRYVSNDDNHAPIEKRCFSSIHWTRSQVGILLLTQLRHAA